MDYRDAASIADLHDVRKWVFVDESGHCKVGAMHL